MILVARVAQIGESVQRGSETASATIWNWRGGDERAEARRARIGGALRGVIGGLVGGAMFLLGHVGIAYVAWSLSGGLALLALLSPLGAHAVVLRAMNAAGRMVGTLVGWILLTPVYFFFFVPFRVLFRRGTRDRMNRRIDPDATSYWRERADAAQVPSMKRPY